jgi:hypothetical protein
MNTNFFCDVVDKHQHFEGKCCLYLQSRRQAQHTFEMLVSVITYKMRDLLIVTIIETTNNTHNFCSSISIPLRIHRHVPLVLWWRKEWTLKATVKENGMYMIKLCAKGIQLYLFFVTIMPNQVIQYWLQKTLTCIIKKQYPFYCLSRHSFFPRSQNELEWTKMVLTPPSVSQSSEVVVEAPSFAVQNSCSKQNKRK